MMTTNKKIVISGIAIFLVFIVVATLYFIPVADPTSPKNFICIAPRYKLLTTHMPASFVERILGVKPANVTLYEGKDEDIIGGEDTYETATYFLDGWDGSVYLYYNDDRNVIYKSCGHG